MAIYFTDFGSDTLGGLPAGFSQPIGGAGSLVVASRASSISGQSVVSSGGFALSLIHYMGMNLSAGTENEVLVGARLVTLGTSSSVLGIAIATLGYELAGDYSAAITRMSPNGTTIAIGQQNAGSTSQTGYGGGVLIAGTPTANERVWIRYRSNAAGNETSARAWMDSVPEPTVWQTVQPVSTLINDNLRDLTQLTAGFGRLWPQEPYEFDYFALATDGDAAPMPVIPVNTINGALPSYSLAGTQVLSALAAGTLIGTLPAYSVAGTQTQAQLSAGDLTSTLPSLTVSGQQAIVIPLLGALDIPLPALIVSGTQAQAISAAGAVNGALPDYAIAGQQAYQLRTAITSNLIERSDEFIVSGTVTFSANAVIAGVLPAYAVAGSQAQSNLAGGSLISALQSLTIAGTQATYAIAAGTLIGTLPPMTVAGTQATTAQAVVVATYSMAEVDDTFTATQFNLPADVWAYDAEITPLTAAEIAAGFTCGLADPNVFNWLHQNIDLELDALELITSAGEIIPEATL